MNFEYPYFLYALFSLTIPIVIHLFNLRRFKKVYFSDITLLKEVQEETKKYSKLKNLLILLSRLLALAFLVLAFAKPYVKSDDGKLKENLISIYIDNSFSMESQAEDGNLLENAKIKAQTILKNLSKTDRVQVITNSLTPEEFRFNSPNVAQDIVDQLKINAKSITIPQVQKIISSSFSSEGALNKNKKIFIISDFQKNFSWEDFRLEDSSIQTNIVQIENQTTKNLVIDSLWFETPLHQVGLTQKIGFRVKNYSNDVIKSLPIKLDLNNTKVAFTNIYIEANSYKDSSLSFISEKPSFNEGKLYLDDAPIQFDDTLKFNFENLVRSELLIIEKSSNNKTSKSYQKLFSSEEFALNVVNIDTLDTKRLELFDAIFICDIDKLDQGLSLRLNEYVKQGGICIVNPENKSSDISSLSYTLNTFNYQENSDTNLFDITIYNPENRFYKDAFIKIPKITNFPKSKNILSSTSSSNFNGEVLLETVHKKVALSRVKEGNGFWYIYYFPFQNSNYLNHSFFVVTSLRMIEDKVSSNQFYQTIGSNENFEVKIPEGEISTFKMKSNKKEFIPQFDKRNYTYIVNPMNQVNTSDQYYLSNDSDTLKGIAFNYNRQESKLEYFNSDEFPSYLNQVQIDEKNSAIVNTTKQLWSYFILLTLVFLLVEIILIKLL